MRWTEGYLYVFRRETSHLSPKYTFTVTTSIIKISNLQNSKLFSKIRQVGVCVSGSQDRGPFFVSEIESCLTHRKIQNNFDPLTLCNTVGYNIEYSQ